MKPSSTVRYGLAALAIAVSCSAQAAHAPLGFSVSVSTDGFFSRTLKQVTVTSVVPGAPAAAAGLLEGDDVESLNDIPVAGSSGSRIMDIVQAVQPGDHLRMKVRRKGTEHLIDIVGGAAK